MGAHFSARVYVLRRSRLGIAVSALGAALSLVAVVVGVVWARTLWSPPIFTLLLMVATLRNSLIREPEIMTVRANRRGLLVGDDELVPGTRITGAELLGREPGPMVRVNVRGAISPIEMIMKSTPQGQSLIRALGSGAAGRAAEDDAFARGEVETEAAALDRGELAVAAWLSRLRAIAAGARLSHRTAPLVPERLISLVESPSAPPSLRVAAAIALGASRDARDRARVYTAAATAPPRLRIALEAAADPHKEAEMEALLAEMDGEDEEADLRAGRARPS